MFIYGNSCPVSMISTKHTSVLWPKLWHASSHIIKSEFFLPLHVMTKSVNPCTLIIYVIKCINQPYFNIIKILINRNNNFLSENSINYIKLDLWGIRYMSHCVSYFSYPFSLWNVVVYSYIFYWTFVASYYVGKSIR